MRIIFSKGKTIFSDLITKIDETDVSHVALSSQYFCNHEIIFHSSVDGVEIVTIDFFKKRHEIKRAYDIALPSDEASILKSMMVQIEGARYDYFATLYAGFYLICEKLGLSIPRKNLWNNRNHFMCIEFVGKILFNGNKDILGLRDFESKIKDLIQ